VRGCGKWVKKEVSVLEAFPITFLFFSHCLPPLNSFSRLVSPCFLFCLILPPLLSLQRSRAWAASCILPSKIYPSDTSTQKLAAADYPDLECSAELPEYDLRRVTTAKDPLAVIEGFWLEIRVRLATVLGLRMCPLCPHCNVNGRGCQDKFGCNMRPGGGVLGGSVAIGAGVEHQGYGTPHLHGQVHVASIYQFGTLREVRVRVFEIPRKGLR